MYGSREDSAALALASGLMYFFGLLVVCPPKNAALPVPLQWQSEMKPRSISSF